MGRFSCTNSVPGSPPRGRGKALVLHSLCIVYRITPAWAGKILADNLSIQGHKDHPRAGGEKIIEPSLLKIGGGSPPHRRGKEQGAGGRMAAHGITPAWAGKRQTAAMPRTMTRVHPRMGREKTMYFEDKYFCRGSPPRRRGKVVLTEHHHAAKRITPAWAGKSACRQ